jgi:hypothetical protein
MQNKKQWAFVGPRKRINRLWESEQQEPSIPLGVSQVFLSSDQLSQVLDLRRQRKHAAWIDGQVTEFTQDIADSNED